MSKNDIRMNPEQEQNVDETFLEELNLDDPLIREILSADYENSEAEEMSAEDEQRATAVLDDDLVRQVLSSVAYDDMEKIGEAEDPEDYCNFSNGYGRKERKENAFSKMSKEDRIQTVLMFVAGGLGLGIIGLMVYWLEHFLQWL